MRLTAILIDWFGPFESPAAATAAIKTARITGEVIYVCIGKCKGKHKRDIQYVGITKNSHSRFSNHAKIPLITREFEMWLGFVESHATAGRRTKGTITHSKSLGYAEWLLSYFLRTPLNQRKKTLPRFDTSLHSRWFAPGQPDKPPRRKRPHPDWPDYIIYESYLIEADLVWFSGSRRRKRLNELQIRQIGE